MSIDGLLTFFGFLAAGFALLDEVSKLRILLHIKRQLVLFLLAFAVVGFLILPEDPAVSMPEIYPNFVSELVVWADATSVGAGGIAFLVVISWVAVALFLYQTARPTAASLKKLSILAERLITQKRYLELVNVVKPYVPLTSKASQRLLRTQRLHDWLANGGPFALGMDDWLRLEEKSPGKFELATRTVSSALRKAGRVLVSPLARLVPARKEATQTATDLEISLLNTTGLKDFLVSSRADFIIDLMVLDRFSTEEFFKDNVERMVATPDSHFFREIRLMDSRYGAGGYVYEDQLVLMKKFALDSEFSNSHGIWKPFGDAALSLIRNDVTYRERLLAAPPDDPVLFDDPVFCTAQFFSAMVGNAARDGVEYHMWLMYMSLMSEELIELHSHWDPINQEDEFPTLAMRLIYEITCVQRDWIQLWNKLPVENYHASEAAITGWDNASVVMWALRDYAKTVRYAVNSVHLPERFRLDRWSSYVRFVSETPNEGRSSFIRASLIREAIEPHEYSRLGNMSAKLRVVHDGIDPLLRYAAEDITNELAP